MIPDHANTKILQQLPPKTNITPQKRTNHNNTHGLTNKS